MGTRSLTPRVIDPALLKDIRQVDFVTYISNPHYQRDKPHGEAARKVAHLRNKRLQPKQSAENRWADALSNEAFELVRGDL